MLLKSAILPLSYFKKSWVFGLALGVLLILFGFRLSTAHAENISIDSTKNCDANSVMWCGADSVSDIASKYNSGDGHNTATSIQSIYSYYGINDSDIAGLSNGNLTVEPGSVNTSGYVFDSNGNKIATGAITGGRENISGSTEETIDGTTFYKRPPSVSFVSSSLPAYVVMKNGHFDFAILASCGNPVEANPVTESSAPPQKVIPQPKPTPTPTPAPTPVPPPAPAPITSSVCSGSPVNINGSASAAQGGNCSTNTSVVQVPTTTVAAPAATGVCSSLDVSVDPSNPLDVTATANSAVSNNATLESAVFNFGDGTVTSPSTDTSQNHVYAAADNYIITATLTYAASGQTVSPSTCQADLTMATPASTPVNPPTVSTAAVVTTTTPTTTLVNTGPGDVVGVFGITTLIGTIGYHSFLKRRFS
jgi:hypothetical protein